MTMRYWQLATGEFVCERRSDSTHKCIVVQRTTRWVYYTYENNRKGIIRCLIACSLCVSSALSHSLSWRILLSWICILYVYPSSTWGSSRIGVSQNSPSTHIIKFNHITTLQNRRFQLQAARTSSTAVCLLSRAHCCCCKFPQCGCGLSIDSHIQHVVVRTHTQHNDPQDSAFKE